MISPAIRWAKDLDPGTLHSFVHHKGN